MLFELRSHTTWSQDLMKLRSLMSHCRKNSVRDKVIGKKWIYLERNTLHRQSVGHLSFYRGGYFHRLTSGRSIAAILGKGWGFPGIRSPPTF